MADTLGISTSLAEPAVVTAPRPQPLGIFGLPLGYLLIPGGPETDHVRTAMLAGQLPDTWPAGLRTSSRWPVTGRGRSRRWPVPPTR